MRTDRLFLFNEFIEAMFVAEVINPRQRDLMRRELIERVRDHEVKRKMRPWWKRVLCR